jgi:hypothetical protein
MKMQKIIETRVLVQSRMSALYRRHAVSLMNASNSEIDKFTFNRVTRLSHADLFRVDGVLVEYKRFQECNGDMKENDWYRSSLEMMYRQCENILNAAFAKNVADMDVATHMRPVRSTLNCVEPDEITGWEDQDGKTIHPTKRQIAIWNRIHGK